jgi:anthranilate phosphoribosyltransferase
MADAMIVEVLQKVVGRQDLSREEAYMVMEFLMTGRASDAEIAAFLTAMRMKGETVEELCGFVQVMRGKVTAVHTRYSGGRAAPRPGDRMLVDTCGTGGDAKGTFNISTAAAFVVSGAGIPVAKHGNRSVSGLCGSADVIEALGVSLDLPAERVGRCIDEVGIGFLFAPLLHPAMKHVMSARRQIRIRTLFNILGPLTNPAGASAQVIGVSEAGLTDILADVLRELGCYRAFVVHGKEGLDEISTVGETKISEVVEGRIRTFYVQPEDFGIPRGTLLDLQGGDATTNAEVIRKILQGARGPQRDIVLVNAAAAIAAGGGAQNIQGGVAAAEHSIDSGAAWTKLEKVVAFCHREGGTVHN